MMELATCSNIGCLIICWCALYRWQKNSDMATPQVLKQALLDMKLLSIVHKYLDAV